MSRTAKEAIKTIFSFLHNQIDLETQQYIIEKQRLIVPNLDYEEENKHAFINGKISSSVSFFIDKPVIGLKYAGQSYVLIPEHSSLASNFAVGLEDNILESEESISEGLSLAILSEKIIPLKPQEDLGKLLIEEIFGIDSQEQHINYEFQEISKFFIDFEIWKVDSNIYDVENELDLHRVYCLYLIEEKIEGNKNSIILNLKDDSLNQVKSLLEDPKSNFIADVIFKALTSTHWEHCFLEFYRCIENIYNIFYIDKLKTDLGIDTKRAEKSLEDIGFKSAENINIRNLFGTINLSLSSVNDLKDALGCQSQETDVFKIKVSIADKVYSVRCSIAHLKYKHTHPNFDSTQWNQIIKSLCEIISELYTKYSVCLVDLYA